MARLNESLLELYLAKCPCPAARGSASRPAGWLAANPLVTQPAIVGFLVEFADCTFEPDRMTFRRPSIAPDVSDQREIHLLDLPKAIV